MCKKEVCLEEDHTDVLCEVADEYARECLNKGICLEYRHALNCTLPSCAVNSHFQECGKGCDTTCDAVICDQAGGPGCGCDEDMVKIK